MGCCPWPGAGRASDWLLDQQLQDIPHPRTAEDTVPAVVPPIVAPKRPVQSVTDLPSKYAVVAGEDAAVISPPRIVTPAPHSVESTSVDTGARDRISSWARLSAQPHQGNGPGTTQGAPPAPPAGMGRSLSGLQKKVAERQQRVWDDALRADERAAAEALADHGGDDARPSREAPAGLSKVEQTLWSAFVLADRDGNGMLSRWEFTLALKAVNLIGDDAEARREWLEVDSDGSGAIEWPEFRRLGNRRSELMLLSERLEQEPEKVQHAALVIQKHTSFGKRHRPPSDKPPPPTSAIKASLASKDQTASARLWDERMRAESCESAHQSAVPGIANRAPPPGLNRFETALWSAFILADRDGNGRLSRWEFTLALTACGIVADEADARHVWKRVDTDGSGAIEWPEFRDLGKERKQLATLVERLASIDQTKVKKAAVLIQSHSRRRLVGRGDGMVGGDLVKTSL